MNLSETLDHLLDRGYSKVIRSKEDRQLLVNFFYNVGKPLSKTGCQSCIQKAFFLLSSYKNKELKNFETMSKKYTFVNKDIKYRDRFSDNKIITSENLTDEIAARMISRNQGLSSLFYIVEDEPKPQPKVTKAKKPRKKKISE